jgi:YVTN family beta-propeller protein
MFRSRGKVPNQTRVGGVGQSPAATGPYRLRLHFQSCLVVVALALASTLARAQTQGAPCKPNTANYPCVYVANEKTNSVSVLNANTNRVIGTIAVGGSPKGLAVTPDNKSVYVANSADNSVSVIDTATGTVTTTVTSPLQFVNANQIAITPDGKFAYVVEPGSDGGAVERIDTANSTIVDSVSGVSFPTAIAFSPDGTRAYVTDKFVGTLCDFNTCIDVVDTTAPTPFVSSSIGIPNFLVNGSIAVTAGGSIVCVSLADFNLSFAVVCTDPTATTQNVIPLGQSVPTPSSYGLVILPNNLLYVAEGGPNSPDIASMAATLTSTPAVNTIPVGTGPVAVAIGPGGGSIYVTNSGDDTMSIIDVATNAVTTIGSGGGFSDPQGVAAMTVVPPVIATQPASQTILSGSTATLSVVATSAAPATLQWYQGLAGDTSSPIEGAIGSSFTTPILTSTTSYWVQVTNIAGLVSSNTATVTVTTNRPPTCTLSVEGAGSQTFTDPLSVVANASCSDPQGAALTATIDFGDGTPPVSVGPNSHGVYVATHTYNSVNTFGIHVTATDNLGLASAPALYSWTIVPTSKSPPVFSGQSATVTVLLKSPSGLPEVVTFQCTTVTTLSGATRTITEASVVGISCSSNPSEITLTATPQPVTIVIQTTGNASEAAMPSTQGTRVYAFWAPLPLLTFLGIGFFQSHRRRFSVAFALSAVSILALLTASCGGGFTHPKAIEVTPAGSYQVTVIDVPVGSSGGFVQTSLIVPLTVSPYQ